MAIQRRLLLIISFFAVAVSACNDASKQSSSAISASADAQKLPASNKTKKIALVLKTLTNPYFIEMETGARDAAKNLGVDLVVKMASQETAVEQQIQLVDELIQTKIDALVIAPSDSQRLVPILKKAQLAGILVINIDNQLDAATMKSQKMSPVTFISVDNQTSSYQSAKFIADQIKAPGKAAIIEGIRTSENARMRTVGAERAFAENHNLKLVAKETGNWKIDEAYQVTKKIFTAYPDITVLFCANDMMALGAIKYLSESNKKILIASYDALADAKIAVKAGSLAVTVDQQAKKQGYEGIALAVRGLNGEKLPDVMLVDTALVTAQTLQ
ncbi:substrate-binding domain-containing protein [Undibacterium sp. RTI2.1]|uniref:substrate-binding domain-containing protein n=3 Tax=Undibacterium TaxID=401469 RepID=UPI002AB577C1|nr:MULTISPECIES: substrate-binding domain-containing protein [unclassified Undibacterium]MDY7539755.1 substrate-binding domain-containing protein [Undibacterium sp. 5I1]MEB0030774.1 substrate-binding domain-containing protein [Undibacterium sp. RTI2.1]MEB0117107.1 substrate-binding domain-containing protein [Undibacterium sp. RTI2.2]MEB0256790.1 substrate-binding domain-containing protein [Undibacterium sp. 5I1]